MPKTVVVVFERDLPAVNLPAVVLPEMAFRVGVVDPDGKVKKFFEKYKMIQEEVALELSPLHKNLSDAIVDAAQKLNTKMVSGVMTQQQIEAAFDGFKKVVIAAVDGQLGAASDKALAIIQKHAEADKDFKKYKFEMTKEITVGAGTIVIHAAGLGLSSGTFGATSVIHIMGLIKGSVKIYKAMRDILKSTDEILKDLEKEIKALKIDKKKFEKDALGKAKTLGKVTANAFLEAALGVTVFASFKEAARHALVARGKIGYKLVKADKLREELEKNLSLVEELKAMRKKPEVSGQKVLDITFNKIPKLEKEINERILAITHYYERYNTTKAYFDQLEEALTLLEESSKVQKKVEEWLPLFISLLAIPLTLADATTVEELGQKAVEGTIDTGKDIGLEQAAEGLKEAYHKILSK